ncbi:methyltransferase, partial [bacterium]|nr:methyltransferase [bacterium]
VVPVRCEPYLERRDEADLVFLRIGRQDMSRELGFDLLQQAHLALKKGGKCFIAQEGKDPQIQQHAAALFGGVTLIMQSEGDRLLVGKKRGPLEEITSYAAEFELTVQGKEPVTLSTVPGVFSHRQVDAGALALAEVVESQPGDSVIDMGCGSGAIGISLARNQELTRICFVDSNSRATLLTEKNCLRNGIENAEVVLSDKGPEGDGEFTLFVGNPPYYSNFRIAELFVRTAHRALKPGGRAYIVAKTAEWHRDFMKQIFGNAEVLNRRGYEIVKSVKSQEK